MTDRPSLGHLYAFEVEHQQVALQGSIGDQYSSYISDDTAATGRSRSETPDPRHPSGAGDESDERSRAGLGRASALMASGTLVSRILGMARAALQASVIGIGVAGNTWSTANTLPNIIYLLLAGGVINAVLVPQITKSLSHDDGGKGYTDRLLTLALSMLVVVTAVFMACAPLVYRLYDSAAPSERLQLGTSFALICLPQILFYGIYTLFGQVLNARGKYGAFMWAPALANVVAIAGLVLFLVTQPDFGSNGPPIAAWNRQMIWMLAGSATLGIAVQAFALIRPLRNSGYRFTPNFRWRGVGLRSASKVALWAFAAVILQQLGLIITTNVLNTQVNGEPGKAAQEPAFLLFMLPHSLVTVSLVTALFTRMSKAANIRDHALVRSDLREGLKLTAVATVPCTVGAFVLGIPLVTVLFGADKSWSIGSFMIAMMLGLAPFGLCVLVQRVFYAYEDARTPFRMQVLCTGSAAIITLGCLFIPDHYMGVGIGLSLTVSNLLQGLVGFRWLSRTTGPIPVQDVLQTYARLAIASLVGAAGALAVRLALGTTLGSGRAGSLLVLVVGGLVFLTAYVLVARRLRVSEIDDLVRPVTSRIGALARR